MTKRDMATALTWYYPRTTLAYWLRLDKASLQLNYDSAVRQYGLMPTR